MRDDRERIELSLEQRQVALLAAAALIVLGSLFALGVLVGRTIASASLAAPQQPPPGDLAALDKARPPGPPPPDRPAQTAKAAEPPPDKAAERPPDKAAEKPGEKVAEKPADRPAEKPAEAKSPPAPVSAEKPAEKPEPKAAEAPKAQAKAAARPEAPAAADAGDEASDAPVTPPPADRGAFTVQLGASPEAKVARKLEERARRNGLAPYTVVADLGAKGTWYRVRAGSFATKEEAAQFQKDVEEKLHVSGLVMPAK